MIREGGEDGGGGDGGDDDDNDGHSHDVEKILSYRLRKKLLKVWMNESELPLPALRAALVRDGIEDDGEGRARTRVARSSYAA
jgi:hypothetical protein